MSRHFILTNMRSGSNFLTSTINKHPGLLNFGEVLGEWTLSRKIISRRMFPDMSDDDYLDFIYRSRWVFYCGQAYSAMRRARHGKPFTLKFRSDVKSIGLKDMASLIRQRNLKEYFERSGDIKIIQLLRANTLKRFVSFERMQQTKIVSTEGTEQREILELDTKNLIKSLRTFRDEDCFAKDLVRELPKARIMEVRYEEYFFDSQRMKEINDALFQFLGAEPLNIISDQKKISPDNLKQILANYSEVCRVLAGTEFEEFLE